MSSARGRQRRRPAGHPGVPRAGGGRAGRHGVGPRQHPRSRRPGRLDEGGRVGSGGNRRGEGHPGRPRRFGARGHGAAARRVSDPHRDHGGPAGRGFGRAHALGGSQRVRRARRAAAPARPCGIAVLLPGHPPLHADRRPDQDALARCRAGRCSGRCARLPDAAARHRRRRPRCADRGHDRRAARPGLPDPADRDGGGPAAALGQRAGHRGQARRRLVRPPDAGGLGVPAPLGARL